MMHCDAHDTKLIYLNVNPLSACTTCPLRTWWLTVFLNFISLVSNLPQYLPSADLVVVMSEGRVLDAGSQEALTARGIDFHKFAAVRGHRSTIDSVAFGLGDLGPMSISVRG